MFQNRNTAEEQAKKDGQIRDVNLARTIAVFEDEGHNIDRRRAEQTKKESRSKK